MKHKTATGPARYCAICGRRLKSADSVHAGIGPKCLKAIKGGTLNAPNAQKLLFGEEENAIAKEI